MVYDDTPVVYEVVHKFKNQQERGQFMLAAQWPEDKEKFKQLITPTNLSEVPL